MKILIADDHSIVREGIKFVVSTIPEVDCIDEAIDGLDAFNKLKATKYDMAILDISMPNMSGLEVLIKMKEKQINTKVLVLSLYPQEQYAIQAFKLGAFGYLSKDSAFEELKLAITKISNGEKYISSALAEKILFSEPQKALHETLSERELQVMILLAKGKGISEIANEIFISEKTVSTYRSRVLEKMDMKKNAELTMYAIKHNLIEL